MSLPELIEIVPLRRPVRAEITVPGSKSITNRALILAALAEGEVTLAGALWSEDTQVMTVALRTLGFEVAVVSDPDEFCNRTITIKGQGGRIPRAGTAAQPLELFVGNAGTAARFLAAMVCLGDGVFRLSGVPRMHERPQAALFQAMRELGYRVEATNDKLPAVIHGQARAAGRGTRNCAVSIDDSSQFASALLLSAKPGGWKISVLGDDAEEAPYVTMTEKLLAVFPSRGGTFQIEPDASSGSYFWAAGGLAPHGTLDRPSAAAPTTPAPFVRDPGLAIDPKRLSESNSAISEIAVSAWPRSHWQIDSAFVSLLSQFQERTTISRRTDLGDSIMTAITLASFCWKSMKFTDLGRLRVQECERVLALRTELTKCGAQVVEYGDTLTVHPARLHGAEIETYNDHRMAMCFAILGLKVVGIKIRNPACVKKTFPNFFQKLVAPPPKGLGAEIREGQLGRKLGKEELFAD